MINKRCILKRKFLPFIPCDCKQCVWYVYEQSYNNCFWVLSNVIHHCPEGLPIEEVARLENTTKEEIELIIEEALHKCRENIFSIIQKSNGSRNES